MSAIITLEHIYSNYLIPRQGLDTFKGLALNFGKGGLFTRKEILKDVSLEINRGESVGIIGRNGSGKSTLLRVIAGIVLPSKGKVTVNGRIAPLLALGAGMEPEFTGHENIELCCTLMGMDRKKLKSLTERILNFSGLRPEDLDMQMKRYSSGMVARLSFSIATAETPDILLVDEVLAVGDLGFQQKCVERFNEIKKAGSTIVYVSHHYDEIKRICNRAVCLESGVLEKDGTVPEIEKHYLSKFK